MDNVIENRFQYYKVPTARDALTEEIFICNIIFNEPIKVALDCEENQTMYFYKSVKRGDGYKLVCDCIWNYRESGGEEQ